MDLLFSRGTAISLKTFIIMAYIPENPSPNCSMRAPLVTLSLTAWWICTHGTSLWYSSFTCFWCTNWELFCGDSLQRRKVTEDHPTKDIIHDRPGCAVCCCWEEYADRRTSDPTADLGPVYMRESCPGDPGHPLPRGKFTARLHGKRLPRVTESKLALSFGRLRRVSNYAQIQYTPMHSVGEQIVPSDDMKWAW